MRFDWPADEEFQGGQQAGGDERDRPLAPEGTHTAKIVWAGEQLREWARDEQANPTGAVLTLKLDVGQAYRPLWESVRIHWRSSIEAICRAAGVDIPTSGAEWSESQLVGQVVQIEVLAAVSKGGREYVKIEKWRQPEAPKVETRAARTPAAKVKAASPSVGSDDIPF
jgi:hypothetical protein